jgi:hypothetical protein
MEIFFGDGAWVRNFPGSAFDDNAAGFQDISIWLFPLVDGRRYTEQEYIDRERPLS